MSKLPSLIKTHGPLLKEKKTLLGFDGFIDTVFKVVRQKESKGNQYFDTIREFGAYTEERGGKNFSLQLDETITKLGGNMPIMANALAHLGAQVTGIGALGYPHVHPVFEPLSKHVALRSYADPGTTTALEFDDGKILLAQMTSLNKADWNVIKERVNLSELIQLFQGCDLIGILNWSELDHATNIWKGVLSDVLPNIPAHTNKPVGFFDLCDCSGRSDMQVLEALALLKKFAVYWNVVLSLNLNEAHLIYKTLLQTSLDMDKIEAEGKKLLSALGIHTLIIHYSAEALAWDADGFHQEKSVRITSPKISTGAGDNFNAGYCAGALMDIGTNASLALGHAVAGHYMRTGNSPSLNDLSSN